MAASQRPVCVGDTVRIVGGTRRNNNVRYDAWTRFVVQRTTDFYVWLVQEENPDGVVFRKNKRSVELVVPVEY